jgi:hypothetical protein
VHMTLHWRLWQSLLRVYLACMLQVTYYSSLVLPRLLEIGACNNIEWQVIYTEL